MQSKQTDIFNIEKSQSLIKNNKNSENKIS